MALRLQGFSGVTFDFKAAGKSLILRGMKRRQFLAHSSLFVTSGLLLRSRLGAADAPAPKAAAPAIPAPPSTEFRALRRNVGIFTGQGGTIGWLSNADGLAIVDTQFPATAGICLEGLPGRAGRKLDVVINTHHHGDHTGGNRVFKSSAKMIVAHANVPKLQYERAEKDGKLDAQVYADTTFPQVWRKDIGDESITARYHGAAHTNGDAIIHFEKANVVHMGDLMFNRIYPVIDRPGGASMRHWIVVLEEVAKEYPADAMYVFGHGNPKFGVVGKRSDLLIFRDYLTGVLDYVQKKITAGEAKGTIVALENLPGFEDYHLPLPNRLGGNLGVAYDELTEKKG
jgi:cyclase